MLKTSDCALQMSAIQRVLSHEDVAHYFKLISKHKTAGESAGRLIIAKLLSLLLKAYSGLAGQKCCSMIKRWGATYLKQEFNHKKQAWQIKSIFDLEELTTVICTGKTTCPKLRMLKIGYMIVWTYSNELPVIKFLLFFFYFQLSPLWKFEVWRVSSWS